MNVECHGDQDTTWDHEKWTKNQRDTTKRIIENKTGKMCRPRGRQKDLFLARNACRKVRNGTGPLIFNCNSKLYHYVI